MSFSDPQFVHLYEKTDGERTEDIAFYLSEARAANGAILDAGCGTGRLLLPMLREGLDAGGFEPSEPMMEILQSHLTEEKFAAHLELASLETLDPETFADQTLIICAF